MRKYFLLLTALLWQLTGFCQDCNCKTTFEWLKKTIEENDAGFDGVLKNKGEAAYNDHTRSVVEKVGKATDKKSCLAALQEWLKFFRTGHLNIDLTEETDTPAAPVAVLDTAAVYRQFRNWERKEIAEAAFVKYLSNKKDQDYEGIWESAPYKIAIRKDSGIYKGYLLNEVLPYWQKGQVKLKIIPEGDQLKGVSYLRDHTENEGHRVIQMGKNYLTVANLFLKRLEPKMETEQEVLNYLKMQEIATAYLNQLNAHTLYLRIPSFAASEKKNIDSVLEANKVLIGKTENLIIDIRGNGGGNDDSFKKLIPYIYTNPIRTVGVRYRSTTLNNQRMLDMISKPEYGMSEEGKKWAKKSYDKLQGCLGQFVSLNPRPVSVDAAEAVLPYPKQVAVVIDGGVGSTAEQFVLAAKQSKKVKLFGTTTFGALDISNMYFVKSPCGEYELGYSLSRSARIPGFIIDDRGIQPDYFMDDAIEEYQWISYINQVLNSK